MGTLATRIGDVIWLALTAAGLAAAVLLHTWIGLPAAISTLAWVGLVGSVMLVAAKTTTPSAIESRAAGSASGSES
jgi:hypothetical protein